MLKSKLLITTALSGVIVTSLGAGTARAAEQTQTAAAAAVEVEEVVITGSRIRGTTDTATPAPVTILSAETLDQRGMVQVGQLLNEMTAIRPAIQQQTSTSGPVGSGQTPPNLFNLGAGRTLSLVNGRRTVTTSSGLADASTDTNIIPTGLLQRVDVIQGGGAAVYGSGAMAGVINYVLRTDYDGFELDTQGSITSRGDYPNYNVRGTAGTNFADGRGNFAINVEWSKSEALNNYDRPNSGALQITNPANVSTTDGISAVLWSDKNTKIYDRIPAGVIFTSASNATIQGLLTVNGGPARFDDAGTGLLAYNPGQITSLGIAIGGDGFPVSRQSSLFAGVERAVMNAIAHYDITDRITLSAEVLHAWTESDDPWGRLYMTNFRASGAAAQGNQAIPFNRTNPYLSAALINTLSAASPTFASGGNLFLGKIFDTDLFPHIGVVTTSKSDRGLIALDGDFEAGEREFYWTLSASHAWSSQDYDAWSYNRARIGNATQVARNTAGQIVCAINADAVTTNDDPFCAPINMFGVGNVSQAARDYVAVQSGIAAFGGTLIPYVNKQDDYLATLGGDIVDLPAGMMKFAVSFEHRREHVETTPFDADQQGIAFTAIPVKGQTSGYSTKEYAGELLIPLISRDQAIPFINTLEANASGRLVDNSFGDVEKVYAAGGRWEPVDGVLFRGSYSRNFRTPNLNQLFQPSSVGTGTMANPCSRTAITAGPAPAVRQANCLALFTANPNYGLPQLLALGASAPPNTPANRLANFQDNANQIPTVLITTAGNPALLNETSVTKSFGIILQPTFLPGLTIAADRIVIDLTNALQQFTGANYASTCFDSQPQPQSFCSTFTYNPDGTLLTAISSPTNAGYVKYRGEIYNINYRFALEDVIGVDRGEMQLGLEVTRNTGSYNFTGLTLTQNDGTTAVPKYVGKFDAHWSYGPLRVNYSLFYLPAQPINRTDTVESTPVIPVHGNARMNISADYQFGDHYAVRAGVNNFLDRLPSYPFAAGYGDIIGRQFYAGLKVRY